MKKVITQERQGVGHGMHKRARKAVIILFWLAVWQAWAVWTNNHILLVGPVEVLRSFIQNAVRPDFLWIVFSSFMRIGLGFFLALFIGLFLGAVGYRVPVVEEVLEPVVHTLKSIPVASFVVLLLIWFGSGRLSFFISFLIVFPNVYVNTASGLKSADAGLLEMAQVFGIGRRNRFFYIYKDALMPYIDSCLKISLGMCWKSGVAAEVIGLPEYSMGERLYMSKIYLDTAGLFAWTLTIVLASFLFEKAVLRLSKAFGAWKPYPALTVRPVPQAACAGGGIEIRQLGKVYGGQPVLRDYAMRMEPGGRYLLMAPSGAGKTTFLRILTGLDKGDTGEIDGMPERTSVVFQEDRLCEGYDAVCNIMLGMAGGMLRSNTGRLYTGGRMLTAQELAEYVRQEAAKILPEDCLTKPVKELSGGMRRRVALLRAVLSDSGMLVLDEPFTGLDEENRVRCASYILKNLKGRTLLATTHLEEDVELLQGSKVDLASHSERVGSRVDLASRGERVRGWTATEKQP